MGFKDMFFISHIHLFSLLYKCYLRCWDRFECNTSVIRFSLEQDHGIAYDTEPPSNLTQEIGSNGERCRVMEQKQTQTSFKDEPCGKPVPLNFAGLCE